MRKELTNEVLNVLEETKVFHLVQIPKITDELYDKLVVAIDAIGGTWSERQRGFVFSYDPTEKIKQLIIDKTFDLTEEKIWKERIQFYPTPTNVAMQMVELAELQEGDIVLEPSAGRGAILDLFPNYVKKVAVELDADNVKVLHQKGHQVFWGDFLAMEGLECTKVIMNPPFSKAQDVKHIMHAYNLLKSKGILVAIVNENTLLRGETNELCRKFLNTLKEIKHEIIHLPEGTFAESGTMINTAILKIWKK